MKVLYDLSHQGHAGMAAGGRRGIFRATDEFIAQALRHAEIECRFTASSSAAAQIDLARYAAAHRPEIAARATVLWRTPPAVHAAARRTVAAGHRLRPLLDRRPLAWRAVSFAPRLFVNRLARFAPAAAQFEIVHSLFVALPALATVQARARVLTIWDLLPITMPRFFPDAETRRALPAIIASVRADSDWVICSSAATKADLMRLSDLPPERVFVVPLAASQDRFHPETDAAAIAAMRDRYGIPAGPYLLSLGAVEPRKNLPHLVAVFHRLLLEGKADLPALVLAGVRTGADPRLEAACAALGPLQGRLVFTGAVADTDLAALYSGARAFVFPSLAEGFGLPPLEAMQCGTPVICSNAGSLPEVTGDAAINVDPRDGTTLLAAMRALLTSDDLARRMQQQSLNRAAAFSWQRTLDATVAVYREALSTAHAAG